MKPETEELWMKKTSLQKLFFGKFSFTVKMTLLWQFLFDVLNNDVIFFTLAKKSPLHFLRNYNSNSYVNTTSKQDQRNCRTSFIKDLIQDTSPERENPSKSTKSRVVQRKLISPKISQKKYQKVLFMKTTGISLPPKE